MNQHPVKFKQMILGPSLEADDVGRYAQFLFANACAEKVIIVPGNQMDEQRWRSFPWPSKFTDKVSIEPRIDNLVGKADPLTTAVGGPDDRLTGFSERMGYRFIFVPHSRNLPSTAPTIAPKNLISPIKRIAIVGPECSGKTTLAEQLATRLQTVFVPEYVRLWIDFRGTSCREQDVAEIIRGQIALEASLEPYANHYLICDTEPRLSKIWSETLYDRFPADLLSWVEMNHYDHYLLTTPDLPWEADGQRCLPEGGQSFFERCKIAFQSTNRPISTISGVGTDRLNKALKALEQHGTRNPIPR